MTAEYNRVHTRVKLTDDEIRQLLTKHQTYQPLSEDERLDLWQFLANFTRNLERRFFGKQDSSKELDLHHERVLYIHDYLQQRRRFKRDVTYELLPTGKLKAKYQWVQDEPPSPFRMLYKLKLTWSAHEAMIRLAPLGIDFSTFDLTGERNRFELAESAFVRYDVVSVLKMQRLYEEYRRDSLIELTLEANPLSKRFRNWKYAGKVMGVEPFVDLLLFAVGHRYGYKQLDESKLTYDYFKNPGHNKGKRVWTANSVNQ